MTFGVCIAGGMNLLDTIIEGSAASPADPFSKAPAAGELTTLCSGTATANSKLCEVPRAPDTLRSNDISSSNNCN